MQAILMAGGSSTRTHPLTMTRPKPLLKIANKPIVQHNLEQIEGIFSEVIIVVGYKQEEIKKSIGNKFGKLRINYVEQKQQLGTAHAVLQAEKFVKERFLVMNCDDLYSRKDIKEIIKHKYALLAKRVDNPQDYAELVIKNNYVVDIVEKPKTFISDIASIGMYVLDKSIFPIIKGLKRSERGEYEIPEAIKELSKKEKVFCCLSQDYWMPVVYSWSILEATKLLLSRTKREIKGVVEKNAVIKGNVAIGKGSIIKSGSYIEGPVIIGENSVVGPNTHIISSTIGDNCEINHSAEVKNSVVYDKTKIDGFCYISNSVIGENCRLNTGTLTAYSRHDHGIIKSVVRGELIETGRTTLGAVLGDNVQTGINTSIFPGRKIWPNKYTLPGEIIKEDLI
ncbi:MAG TPA: bifunctional sugar-1-phosphate nucleotidylyltransferase/acetyltransferase [Candidatus Nanoarchaeia archaeon]|nr:bifunctional sugar-1-phosphate nucleotidylyltransferase/acetyltransferase [Candidatus Nanoarchaeia archaeon]